NSLEDLASLLGIEEEISQIRDEEADAIIREMGEILTIGPEFGFIRDFKTKAKLWFTCSELLDTANTTYSRGEYVVYTRSKNYKGDTAICIHKPMQIKNLLSIVDDLATNGKKPDANEVLTHIFSTYPNCQMAIDKQREINKTTNNNFKTETSIGVPFLYNKARKYNDSKNFDKAIEYYSKAIEVNQKRESAIKDLGMLYVQLAKKSETEYKAIQYRRTAKLFMETNRKFLDKTSVNLSYLENFYYAIKDFDNFKKVVDVILINADKDLEGPRHVFLLNKLASVLIRENQIEQARILLNKAIDLYPEGIGATRLLEIIATSSSHIDEEIESIISATEIEISSGRISPFIQSLLNEFDDYVGVPQSAINKRKFTKDNLKTLRKLIEQFSEKEFAGRSSDRAKHLLTEGKLILELEPDNLFRLRSVMARFCNDMAKVHTYNNSDPEVIRFFYNEAFSLEEKYSATAQQVAYFLLSNVYDLEKLSKEFSKSPSVDYALELVLKNSTDIKVWNTIVSMCMFNREITANILGKLYSNKHFY
ncbi:MAG: tetratricopeptide repeat protein, partial [Bacilli bacterium]|nr:tetratricopeptide repeat protein [Bacilli bacterium]